LGIPTVRDRVVQAAAKIVLEPVFEPDLLPCSYGYRPRKSATEALEAVRAAFPKGVVWVVEFDIADFFGSIDHDVVVGLVGRRVSDRRTLKLIRGWLGAGVLVDGVAQETVSGRPRVSRTGFALSIRLRAADSSTRRGLLVASGNPTPSAAA